MFVHSFIPSQVLQPFIRKYVIISCPDERVNRILPSTALALAFRLNGNTSYQTESGKSNLPSTIFSGLRKSVRLINYESDSATLVVLFRETGAAAFLHQPLYELFEQSVPLDNFIKLSEISLVEEKLAGASTYQDKINIIDSFLQQKITLHKHDLLIQEAIKNIYKSDGQIKIKSLANHLYISQDALEKRFRKLIGASPKQFASIVKLQKLIKSKQSSKTILDIALDAGYYDHSHFIKDFRLFTGQTPTEFFRVPSAW